MVRLKGPLFSLKAQKQLGKTLIFKRKGNRNFLTRYNKPGGQNPFSPSASQVAKRDLYGEAIGIWKAKTDNQKLYWNNLDEGKRLKISGWNLFYKYAYAEPEAYLGQSYHGIRIYGYFAYGKVPLEA